MGKAVDVVTTVQFTVCGCTTTRQPVVKAGDYASRPGQRRLRRHRNEFLQLVLDRTRHGSLRCTVIHDGFPQARRNRKYFRLISGSARICERTSAATPSGKRHLLSPFPVPTAPVGPANLAPIVTPSRRQRTTTPSKVSASSMPCQT